MDPTDAFSQRLDSEQLLNDHGQSLVAEARGMLAQNSGARVAGLVTTPDSPDALAVRQALVQMTGRMPPPGLMVGLVPRQMVQKLLQSSVGSEPWQELGWQPQQVLPVVVSTRDGHRFGFFGIGAIGSSSM
jgi:hypothetical protein